MKKLMAALLMILILTPLTLGAMAGKAPKPAIDLEQSAGWQKLDLRAKMAWEEYKKTGEGGDFDCIMKLSAVPSAADKDALKEAGFKARTFIGQILTGSMSPENLNKVANLSFVTAIELSTPMSLKKKAGK